MRKLNLIGAQFGRLTVTSFSHVGKGHSRWICNCECGSTTVVAGYNLKKGTTRSCGCLHRELTSKRSTTHGLNRNGSINPTNAAFLNAKHRCTIETSQAYQHYGGRGIEFCFDSVEDLIADIGERPEEGLTLDRINNDGHYEPGNVRWTDWKTQRSNQRPYPVARKTLATESNR